MLGHIPRLLRLALIATALIMIPSFYLLYPQGERLPSRGEIQAGGIDSPHWRKPITPNFEQESARDWSSGSSGDDINVDELQHGEGSNWRAKLEDERARARGGRKQTQSEKLSQGFVDEVQAQDDKAIGLEGMISGGVIMPKLGNETAKADLGRAAWRVMHLMTLRYPDEPTEDDRQALKSYFHLFSRLYPCGECATEFQKLLKEFPPQTSSRKTASLWLCHVHNQVNARLGKEEFDCLTLDKTYDCGCGDDPLGAVDASTSAGTTAIVDEVEVDAAVTEPAATDDSSDGEGSDENVQVWEEREQVRAEEDTS